MSWLADGVRIRSYWQEYKISIMAKDSGGIGLVVKEDSGHERNILSVFSLKAMGDYWPGEAREIGVKGWSTRSFWPI